MSKRLLLFSSLACAVAATTWNTPEKNMPLWKKFVPADTPAHAPIYSLHYTQLIDVVKVGEVLQFNSVDYTLVKEVERHWKNHERIFKATSLVHGNVLIKLFRNSVLTTKDVHQEIGITLTMSKEEHGANVYYSEYFQGNAVLILEDLPHDLPLQFSEPAMRGGPSVKQQKSQMMKQLTQLVMDLRKHKIVHLNLSPETIRVSSKGVVKLVEYGSARVETRENQRFTGRYGYGTEYRSPEMLTNEYMYIGRQSDLWSLGVLLCEINNGHHPYDMIPSARNLVLAHNFEFLDQRQKFIKDVVISNLLDRDPLKRVLFNERPIQETMRARAWHYLITPQAEMPILKVIRALEPYKVGSVLNLCKQEFRLVKKLGQGSFGAAYKAVNRDGEVFVVKVLETAKQFDINSEIETMRLMKGHPNTVNLICSEKGRPVTFLVMDWVDGGDLSSVLFQIVFGGKGLPHDKLQGIVEGLKAGLRGLSAQNIIHRDIKPANLLYSSDGTVKIADFGLAKVATTPLYHQVGTIHYMAPEVLRGRAYDSKVDLWSAGLSVFEMSGANLQSVIFAQGGFIEDFIDPSLPTSVREFLLATLQEDPKQRYIPN